MVPSETPAARKVVPDEDLMADPHRDPALSRLLRIPREAAVLPAEKTVFPELEDLLAVAFSIALA